MRDRPFKFQLQAAVTKAVDYTLAPVDLRLSRFRELILTLKVTSAERDTGNELYDFWITAENEAGQQYDLVHFPQIATTGAKTFVARLRSDLLPQTVTTASPGVASVESGSIKTDTSGADQGAKTLVAGTIRHGPWGDKLGYILDLGGTVVTGIAYSIHVEAR